MALTANLVRSTITAPGTESTWTDETVYGGANPDRNEVALYLTAYKVDEDLVETALEVETFDPETVTEFVTTNGEDGYHKYYFIIVDNWLIGTTYNKYDLVWSTAQNLFYQYINDSPTAGNAVTNTNYFSPVADPTSLLQDIGTSEEPQNIVYQIIGKVVDFQTSICYMKASAKHAKETCDGNDCGCDSRIGRLFHKIRDLFNSLALNEAQGQFIQGEKNARLAEKWCDDCGCLTR